MDFLSLNNIKWTEVGYVLGNQKGTIKSVEIEVPVMHVEYWRALAALTTHETHEAEQRRALYKEADTEAT